MQHQIINLKSQSSNLKAILLFLLAALVGCKDDISLPDAGNNPKLVVYCFPSTQDTTWISVSQSLPVKQYRDTVRLRTISNATITYSVNGGQKSVASIGGGYYYVVADQKAGDKIAIAVSADGLPTASAETQIPDTVAVANPNHRIVNIYNDDIERTEEYDQLTASFTDPAATRDFYAVRVEQKYVFDTDSTYYYPDINTKSEPLLMSKTNVDDFFGFSDNYFGGLYIFDDTAVKGQHYTLHLNRYNDDWRTPYFMVEERIELLRLTPEYYNFLKSVNAIENSDLARYGLSQLMPTASNVSGGLGVVGGWNVSHTQWINAHIYYYEE